MGDRRFDRPYSLVRDATDRASAVQGLTDLEVIHALAAASREHDPLLANVLATEAENRMRRVDTMTWSAPACVLGLDADGRILYVNEEALRVINLRREAIVGHVFDEIATVLDEHGEPLRWTSTPIGAALYGGTAVSAPMAVRLPDHVTRRVRCLAAPFEQPGNRRGVVVLLEPEG